MRKPAAEPYRNIDFSGARRGPVIPPEPGKTKISIRLDNRVIDHFRTIVEKAKGGNYQTLINDALVAHIEQQSVLDAVRMVVKEELFAAEQRYGSRVLVFKDLLDFTVLFTLRPEGSNHGYIVHRQNGYYLLDPTRSASNQEDLAPLGTSITEAIKHLPEVLAAERAKYVPYQQILEAVHEGLAPRVLAELVIMSVTWRRKAEELRQLDSQSGVPKQDLLADYETSYRGLQQALEDLHLQLQLKEVQQKTLSGIAATNVAEVDPEEGQQNLTQSIAILDAFLAQMRQMEQPTGDATTSNAFRMLFAPLGDDELNRRLGRLAKVSEGVARQK